MKKKKDNIQNPHDSFFKYIFSDKNNVGDFLRGELPEEMYKKLDLTTLEIDENSYVDEELRNYFADLVYQCKYGDDTVVKIAILFEHKSYIPQYPHLQLLKYMLKLWEKRIQNREPLHPVIPIIIYHGQETWHNQRFEQYFGSSNLDPALKSFLPIFDYWLCNLQERPIDSIKKYVRRGEPKNCIFFDEEHRIPGYNFIYTVNIQ